MELEQAVRGLFASARRPGRVGVEVELIPVTGTGAPQPVDPAVLVEGFDAGFVASLRPSFEPGGQLELSPPPRGTVGGLVDEVHRLLARAADQQRAWSEAAAGYSPESAGLLSIARTVPAATGPVPTLEGAS